jgi:hypothetical protein
MPVAHIFDFQTVEGFESQARDITLAWVPDLVGEDERAVEVKHSRFSLFLFGTDLAHSRDKSCL